MLVTDGVWIEKPFRKSSAMPRTKYSTLDEHGTDVRYADARRSRKSRRKSCLVGTIILIVLLMFILALILLLLYVAGSDNRKGRSSGGHDSVQCTLDPVDRFECYPEGSPTKDLCENRGCCWNSSSEPLCYYPSEFGYLVEGQVNDTDFGYSVALKRNSSQPSQYGGDVDVLHVDVMYETQYRLRVKVKTVAVVVFSN